MDRNCLIIHFCKLLLFLIIVFCQNDAVCHAGYTECQGFDSPTLTVMVNDATNKNPVETANVYLHFKDLPIHPIGFDVEKKVYFGLLREGGTLDLRVEHPDYQSFRDSDFKIDVNGSCGANNDWVYSVYLCPKGNECSQGPVSRKIPPQNP